jgi:uncharacterized protein DUF1217
MFLPTIPLNGYAGWKFLQTTLDRQQEAFNNNSSIKNDIAYFSDKLKDPISLDDFIADRRLLRITVSAFGLAGEENKGALVKRVLKEGVIDNEALVYRLNNPKYTALATAIPVIDGEIFINSEARQKMIANFQQESFNIAVGEVNNNMRLALNYSQEITDIVSRSKSDDAIWYSILGSTPVRTVLEGALSLPSEFRRLDVDRQADILKTRAASFLKISSPQDLLDPAVIEKAIQRFQITEQVKLGPNLSTPGYAGVLLLQSSNLY